MTETTSTTNFSEISSSHKEREHPDGRPVSATPVTDATHPDHATRPTEQSHALWDTERRAREAEYALGIAKTNIEELEVAFTAWRDSSDKEYERANKAETRVAELERELAWLRNESAIRSASYWNMTGMIVPLKDALGHLASKPPADWKP